MACMLYPSGLNRLSSVSRQANGCCWADYGRFVLFKWGFGGDCIDLTAKTASFIDHVKSQKFMKKSKEKAEKEQEIEDSRAIFSDAITAGMKHGGNRFIIESSYMPCEDLIVGRLSFQGMNPEIERIMQAECEEKIAKLPAKNEADVSDQEMAQRYSSLVGTVARRFNTKRENRKFIGDSEIESRKKRAKFLKPAD